MENYLGRPLAGDNIVQLRSGKSSFTEYEVLTAAEQYALRFYLSGGQECTIEGLGDGFEKNIDTLASTTLLIRAAQLFRKAESDNNVVLGDTRLKFLSNPIALIEFRRFGRHYHSLFLPQEVLPQEEKANIELETIIGALVREFATPEREFVSDAQLKKRFTSLSAHEISLLPGSLSESEYDANQRRHEFRELMRPLAEHLFKTVNSENVNNAKEIPVNRFCRAAIQNWREGLEAEAVDSALSSEARDALNVYPYVCIHRLQSLNNALLVLCVTPIDRLFQDERIELDHRMPGISIAICSEGTFDHASSSDLLSLQEAFRARLSSLSAKRMVHMRGEAITSSAGEAAAVGRYWFGTGVTNLLKSNEEAGGLESENVFEFWSRFVEDILCAEIDDVSTIEVFPFDRVFLIRETGAIETGSDENTIELLALETALQSNASNDRFEYLTSIERGSRPLEEFDVTKKRIKLSRRMRLIWRHANEIELSDGKTTLQEVENQETSRSITVDMDGDPKDHSAAEVGLAAILSRLLEYPEKQLETEIRRRFGQDGILFEYRHGLELAEESPLLDQLDRAYKHYLIDKSRMGDADPELFQMFRKLRSRKNDGSLVEGGTLKRKKYVYIAFEPTLSLENKRSGKDGQEAYFLPGTERVTLILLADDDQEKSMQELSAERDDLRLLISMILQQKLRDRKREAAVIEKRVLVINGFLDGFMHSIEGKLSEISEEAKEDIARQKRGLQIALQFDQSSLMEIDTDDSPADVLANLWMSEAIFKNKETTIFTLPDLEIWLNEKAKKLSKQNQKSSSQIQIPSVKLMRSIIPGLKMRLPRAAVAECLDVLFKNAVEASSSEKAPGNAEIVIEALARPMGEQAKGKWALDIVIENTTAVIDTSVWRKLTAEYPERQEKNNDKAHSTGVGVFAARHLLRNGLGQSADIRYQMAGQNRIQARMTIPVQLSSLKATNTYGKDENEHVGDSSILPIQSITSQAAILYVEDMEEFYTPSIEALNEQCNISDAVVHVKDLETAKSHISAGLPGLLITDLGILERLDSSTPDSKNGYLLLEKFLEAGVKDGSKPPVWIVTANDYDGVASNLEDQGILDEGYVLSPKDTASKQLVENGVITILEHVKDLSHNATILKAAAEFANQMEPQIEKIIAKRGYFKNQQYKSILFNNKFSTTLENKVGSLKRGNEFKLNLPLFIATPTKKVQFERVLNRWFTCPKIPDLDNWNSKRSYPVTNPVFHKRIVLHYHIKGDEKYIGPDLRYWLIRRNVLIHDGSPDQVSGIWNALINESKGPLSRLRHDVLNLRLESLPEAFFHNVTDLTKSAESNLQINAEVEKSILASLNSGDIDQLEALFENLREDNKTDRFDEVKVALESIEAELRELMRQYAGAYEKLRETLPMLIHSVEATQQILFSAE